MRFRQQTAGLMLLAALAAGCSGGGATLGPAPASKATASPTATASASGSASPNASASPTPLPTATATATGGTTNAAIPFPAATDSDPFYAQPSSFPNVANGTILDSRSVTFAPVGGTPMQNKAWQLKFASRDVNGNPIAAVATVVLPLTPAVGTVPLLADQLAEDGLGASCAPSHSLTGSTNDATEQAEAPLGVSALGMGWVVVFPDNEGPYSEYGPGQLEGNITLDSIRAALAFAPLGLNAKTPVGLYGYSGGAIAGAWAASLAPSYAPELDIVGVASGGTPADVKGIAENIDSNQISNAAFFALIFSAIVGENRGYPSLVTPILNAKGVAAATSLENGCVGATSNGAAAPTGKLADYTTVSDPLDAPNVAAVFPKITLPLAGHSPIANTFVFHSQLDELIPIAGPDAMVAAWCAAGSPVQYYRGVSGDHIGFEATVGPLALTYLASRFDGTPTVTPPGTTNCNV